jgi:hemolysin activation/secretion protein
VRARGAQILVVGRALAAVAALFAPAPALAQALERHPAPSLPLAPAPQLKAPAPSASDDATPLGPNLEAVVLIGAADSLPPSQGPAGIDASRLAAADRRPVERALAGYLGRPLSRKLISEVEAAVVRAYRRAGRPLVSVSAPPQEVSAGRLTLRVIAFRLGGKAAAGASQRLNAAALAGVRAAVGQPIDAPKLEEDLAWLNRSPFHQVTAVFSPGAELGETDLSLHVAATKPWRIQAGYANDGTPSSGIGRWLLSAEVGDLGVPGSLVSYQLTSSDDFWVAHRQAFGDAGHPQYLSHSLSIDAPIAPRTDLELSGDFIESRTTAQAGLFATGDETAEGSALIETALSNFTTLPGNLAFGVESRWQRTDTFFDAVPIRRGAAAVDQAVLGWRWAGEAAGGPQTLSLFLRLSPGGLSAQNGDAAFAAASQGRVKTSDYAYADFAYSGALPLPGGWRYEPSLSVQLADQPLLDTEQMALGGEGAARTYVYDDGAFDSGVVFRSELHAPPVAWTAATAADTMNLGPFLFADAARGSDLGHGPSAQAASLGGGFDLGVRSLSGRLAAGWSLLDGPFTRAGAFKFLAQLRAAF